MFRSLAGTAIRVFLIVIGACFAMAVLQSVRWWECVVLLMTIGIAISAAHSLAAGDAVNFPAAECKGCSSLERAKLAARIGPAANEYGIAFIYDLDAETVYKYQTGKDGVTTEIVPVDADMRRAFGALVHVKHVNPDLARTGVARIVAKP